jgi:hypothetical protein
VQRPAPPDVDFDFSRPLDQPEDEFFALPVDDTFSAGADVHDETQPRGKFARLAGRTQAVQALGGKVRSLLDRRDEDAELADILEAGPTRHVDVMGSPLDEHMIVLDSSHDLDSFLAAEQESTLFEDYERHVSVNLRTANVGLIVVALLFAWLGFKHGISYLTSLTDITTAVDSRLTGRLPQETARGVQVVIGALVPALAFLLCAQGATDVFGGLLLRSLRRLAPGMIAVSGGGLTLLMLSTGAYVPALAVAAAVWTVVRLVEAVLAAAEVR